MGEPILQDVMCYGRSCLTGGHVIREGKFEWVKCLTGGMFYGYSCVILGFMSFGMTFFCRYNWYTSGMSCVASVCMNGS